MPKPGGTVARGYGYAHRKLREQWRPMVEAGQVACARCGRMIHPGMAWDLGHDDHDRSVYRGPEHAGPCNRAAGSRVANARRRGRRRPRVMRAAVYGPLSS